MSLKKLGPSVLLLWWILFGLFFPTQGANIDFQGQLELEARYTPEELLQGRQRLTLSSELKAGRDIKAYLAFISAGRDRRWQSLLSGLGALNLTTQVARLEFNGPLYFGGRPVKMSIGDLTLNYSPYLLRADGEYYGPLPGNGEFGLANPPLKGVAIEGLDLFGQSVNAFGGWDGAPGKRVGGVQLKGQSATLTYVGYRSAPVFSDERGNKYYGPLEDYEDDYGLELRFSLPAQMRLQSFWAWQINQEERAAWKSGKVTIPLSQGDELNLFIGYQSNDPAFAPRYRDRTPRFDQFGQRLAWNPVDENLQDLYFLTGRQILAGEAGWEVGLQGFANGTSWELVGAQKALWPQEELPEKLYKREATFTGGTSLRGWQVNGALKYQEYLSQNPLAQNQAQLWHLALMVTKNISRTSTMEAYFRFHQKEGEEQSGGWQQLLYTKTIAAGPLSGASLRGGIRCREGKAQVLAGVNYTTPTGVSVQLHGGFPNFTPDPLYDEEGEIYLGEDNLLALTFSMGF